MRESFRLIAGEQVRTWVFEDRPDYLKNRNLIPPHEQKRYDVVYNYEGTAGAAADENAPDIPENTLATGQIPATIDSLDPTTVPSLQFAAGLKGAGLPKITEISLANAGTPPADPFTPPADLELSFFPAQLSTIVHPTEEEALSPPISHIPVPDSTSLVSESSWTPKLPTLPKFTAINQEPLGRIIAVPVFLCVTFLREGMEGEEFYHYFFPLLPNVNLGYFHDWRLPGEPLLPVSDNTRAGTSKEDWLNMNMETIWEESKKTLAREYELTSEGWKWIKKDWDGELINPETTLAELIGQFLDAEFAEGTPPIIKIVADDETPVVFENAHLESRMSLSGLVGHVESDSWNPGLMIFNKSPLQGWCRVGNAYMLLEGSEMKNEECEGKRVGNDSKSNTGEII